MNHLWEIRCANGATRVVYADEWGLRALTRHCGCHGDHVIREVPSERCRWASCPKRIPVGDKFCLQHGHLDAGLAAAAGRAS
jgi:hypothetical protein